MPIGGTRASTGVRLAVWRKECEATTRRAEFARGLDARRLWRLYLLFPPAIEAAIVAIVVSKFLLLFAPALQLSQFPLPSSALTRIVCPLILCTR